MLRIHCQSCERFTDAAANETTRAIRRVTIRVEGFDGSEHAPDLCRRCIERLLASYASVEPGPRTPAGVERDALMGPPAMPRFLEQLEHDVERLERGHWSDLLEPEPEPVSWPAGSLGGRLEEEAG